MNRFPPARARLGAAALSLLAGCHLVDQRDFNPAAGQRPAVAGPAIPAAAQPPLVSIGFTPAPPDYGTTLAAAVARARAVKPDVLFLIEAACPPGRAEEALRDGAEVAAAVHAAGAAGGQIEQSVVLEAGREGIEVRVRVR